VPLVRAARRRRLGWIGIALVVLGAAVAAVATWYVLHARPHPGAVIDTIAIAGNAQLVVRAEDGGERSFLELHADGQLKWRALIPRYAGAPGRRAVAWSDHVVTVRVARHGRAEVFAFARRDAAKIGLLRLAQAREPIPPPTGPITVTDHARAYELVSGPGWAELHAVDLGNGKGVWKADLGELPIQDAGVADGAVWIRQGGRERRFDPMTGKELL
jgi:hypothetical protein